MRYSNILTVLSLTSAVLSAPLPVAQAVAKRNDGSSIFVPVDINCIGKDLGDILKKRAAEDGSFLYAPITCEDGSDDSQSGNGTSTTTKRADGSSIFIPVDINCIGRDLGDILKKRGPNDGNLVNAPITCEDGSDGSNDSESESGSSNGTSTATTKRADGSSIFVPVDINCIGKDLGDILKKRSPSDGNLVNAPITCEDGSDNSNIKKRDDGSSIFVPVDINCIGKDLGDILRKRAVGGTSGDLLYAPVTCEDGSNDN